jgi:DNA-binding beta-propeller fold protein YncE
MRVKRRLAVAMAGAVAVAGGVASVGLPATSARAATTTVALPISQFSHMLVDPLHQHLFISSAASNSILVTDYSGQTVATIANEPGADGLALSSDGTTVYAALTTGDAVSAISTSSLAETARYATGTGTDPTYVADTSGKIWFGYGAFLATSPIGIGSVDPSTSPATVTLNATNDPPNTWVSAPMLAASPDGELVAGQPLQTGVRMASYDVSSGSAAAPVYGFPQRLRPGVLADHSGWQGRGCRQRFPRLPPDPPGLHPGGSR